MMALGLLVTRTVRPGNTRLQSGLCLQSRTMNAQPASTHLPGVLPRRPRAWTAQPASTMKTRGLQGVRTGQPASIRQPRVLRRLLYAPIVLQVGSPQP